MTHDKCDSSSSSSFCSSSSSSSSCSSSSSSSCSSCSASCSNIERDHRLFREREGIYNAITGRVFDDQPCNIVKRAYAFWTQKTALVINKVSCKLQKHLHHGCARREFEIRFALFQLSVQKLNRLLVCALKRILNKDKRAGKLSENGCLGETYGCFVDEYAENATASAIVTALSTLCVLAKTAVNRDLDRVGIECADRLALERACEAFKIATALEGCFADRTCPPLCKKGKCGRY